jgi:hypothetical protein
MLPRLTLPILVLALGALVVVGLGGCNLVLPPPPPDGDGPDDGDGTEMTFHERIFVDILGKTEYDGTGDSCLLCHEDHARDILETAHWKWEGPVTNIEGLEGEVHGKRDLINNL